MEELHKKWEKIHHCLQALEAADQEQEAEILKKAYECLLCAYQESRALNDEMEIFLKTYTKNLTNPILEIKKVLPHSCSPDGINHQCRICFPTLLLLIPVHLPVFQSHVLSLCISRS